MTDLSHRWPDLGITVPTESCATHCTMVTEARKLRGCSRARRLMCRAEVAEQLYNHLTKSNLSAESLFQLAFDPVVDTSRLEVMGYEAEPRFVQSGHPKSFWFDVARRYGLLVELELAVVRAALRNLLRMPGEPFLSFAISRDTLDDPRLKRLLLPHAPRILLQIQGAPDDPMTVAAHDLLEELLAAGMRRCVDLRPDTRYETLTIALSQAQVVKVASGALIEMTGNRRDSSMTSTLLRQARAAKTVFQASGVHTPALRNAMKSLGISALQGMVTGGPILCGKAAR